jgi:AcrR family transcriptional regulator
MDQDPVFNAALETFIRYGFRKTSMEDIARAVGVSRQALYQQFGSKEALFRLALHHVIQVSVAEAKVALADTSLGLPERLLRAFDGWCGQHVDAIRSSPHAPEILVMANVEGGAVSKAAEESLLAGVARLLGTERAGHTADPMDTAFTLYAASKGLLHTARDRAAYLQSMRTVIRALVGGPDPSGVTRRKTQKKKSP